ncbi:unnamed protein product [Auanema sp. JU1783]|nr:unnamed protein product [Auanema sp. JU1783]
MATLFRRSCALFPRGNFRCERLFSSEQPNPRLVRTEGQRDLTNLDLIEEQIRQKAAKRKESGGQNWVYRSEMVKHYGLDNNHRYTWIAYGLIIIFGFTAFIYVKSNVVMNRKEEMEQREKLRKELNLTGVDRKKIAIVEN